MPSRHTLRAREVGSKLRKMGRIWHGAVWLHSRVIRKIEQPVCDPCERGAFFGLGGAKNVRGVMFFDVAFAKKQRGVAIFCLEAPKN